MKKTIKNMFGAALIALAMTGCTASSDTKAAASKTNDQVIQDYLDAAKSDVKFSYSANGSLSKWANFEDGEYSEAVTKALEGLGTAANEFFTTVELQTVEESEINADNLMFELQPAQGELIYIYSDGHVKTVGKGNRNFYSTESTVLQDAAQVVSEAMSAAE